MLLASGWLNSADIHFSLCDFQLGTVDDDSLEGFYSKSVSLNKQQCQVLLRLTLRKTGCFRARISYKDQPLSNGEFDIIVLSGEHRSDVEYLAVL